MCKLGINIDHVATLRNARGQHHPDPLKAAMILKETQVDSITMHLREDRRHIRDKDIFLIKEKVDLPINLEIAPTEEMIKISLRLNPRSVCFVPEKRMEITTEGGLNIKSNMVKIERLLNLFSSSKINVACFIEPCFNQINCIKSLGIKTVEFHTGSYADAKTKKERKKKLSLIREAVLYASELGIDCHAGHGLNYENVSDIAAIKQIKELNIGHFIIGESIFCGLRNSILKMKEIINAARK